MSLSWIDQFDLFLFDFDGLLVNTEPLHYQAYVNAAKEMGYDLPLSYSNFMSLAHLNAHAWREAVMEALHLEEYETIYQKKKEAYLVLLGKGKIELMPGVEPLLLALQKAKKRRCVATHSPLSHILPLRDRSEVLRTIPHWITREDYEKPKPDPECYLKCIALYGKKGDRIIGFEDSVRGFKALSGTPALACLICPSHHPLLEIALDGRGHHFESLSHISLP